MCLACTCTAGCVQDTVYPGFYGEPARDEQAVTTGPAAAAGIGGTAMQGNGGPVAGTGSTVSAGTGSTAVAGNSSEPAANAGANAPVPEDDDRDACDLSGRWLVTLHYVTDALGQQQTIHSFIYYEIERRDDALAIAKGLHCGDEALAEGVFAVSADFRKAWDAVASKVSYTGRTVSSTEAGGGCEVRLGKWYVARGATYPHYNDPAIALPTLEQPASGATPGWEDWDGDGQPGITGFISGTVTGKIFVAPRIWTQLSGTVPDTAERFELPVAWDQEPNVLSYDGSPLLASEAVRAADPKLHFAEFARLSPAQATGDDLAICRAIVELAPTLTPRASAI
jgi:hypothetical protein